MSRLLTDRRILERRRAIIAERVRRRRRMLLVAVAAVGLSVGLYQLVRSPLFGLTAVRVEGARPEVRAAVLAAADLRLGEPYVAIDPGAVRRRVEALPAVATVRVVRSYPSSLRIVVSERLPTAVVSSKGAYWLVAADGMVVGRVARRPRDLPYVAGVPLPPAVRPGARLAPGNPLANALAALGHMDPVLRDRVVGVTARSIDGLELRLRGGALVLYGVAERQAAKDAAVLLIQRKLRAEGKQVVRIDVRSPSTPTVKEKTAGND
ncbi:MAG TPA: FtsQ-type POTRA domain-containing protein [Actinomycetota bacterium]|nr:FtsQ-type POTRA domain-containing protein [Actinomycetota bacterium]